MNPWALLVILIGIMLVIIGIKGTQHDIAAAITGHASTSGTPADAGGSAGPANGGKSTNSNTQKNQNPTPTGSA